MSEIRVKPDESLDSALRRFKRSCAKSGVLSEVRKREHYESPSVKRRKKSEAARAKKDLIADFQAVCHTAHRLCSGQNQRPADFSAGLLHYHLTIL